MNVIKDGIAPGNNALQKKYREIAASMARRSNDALCLATGNRRYQCEGSMAVFIKCGMNRGAAEITTGGAEANETCVTLAEMSTGGRATQGVINSAGA